MRNNLFKLVLYNELAFCFLQKDNNCSESSFYRAPCIILTRLHLALSLSQQHNISYLDYTLFITQLLFVFLTWIQITHSLSLSLSLSLFVRLCFLHSLSESYPLQVAPILSVSLTFCSDIFVHRLS